MSTELLQRWKDIDTTLPSLLPLQAPPQVEDPRQLLQYVHSLHNYLASDRQSLVRSINVLSRFRNIQTDDKTDTAAVATGSGTLKVQVDTAIPYFDAFSQEAGSGAVWEPLIPAFTQDTLDPTGFVNTNEDSTLSTQGTNLLLAPTGTNYSFYVKGKKFTKTGDSISLVPASTIGNWYVYYDSTGTLVLSNSASAEDIIRDNCFVAELYHTGIGISFIMDERHGLMPWQTHLWLHQNEGTVFTSGLGLGGFSVDGNGNSDVHAELTAAKGAVTDEDLEHSIGAVSGDWDTLALVNGAWQYAATGTASPAILATGVPQYNDISVPGSESLVNVANNDFFLMHVFATNIVMDGSGNAQGGHAVICGQAEYLTKTAAREGANDEIASITTGDLPMPEFLPVGTVIFQRRGSNAYNCAVVSTDTGDDYVSWLGANIQPGSPPSSHKNLTDRDAVSQHPLSSIDGGTSNPIASGIYTGDGGAILNVQPSHVQPTIIPDGLVDPDTGIGSVAANQLSFICGGSERLRFNTADAYSFGNFYIDKTANPAIYLREGGSATNYGYIVDEASTLFSIYKRTVGGAATIRIDPVVPDGTQAVTIQLFRTTNTSGAVNFYIHNGDGTSGVQHFLNGTGSAQLCRNAGTLAIGQASAGSEKLTVIGDASFTAEIKLAYLSAAPSSLANGMIWMESDGLHIYYGGAEKVVAGV